MNCLESVFSKYRAKRSLFIKFVVFVLGFIIGGWILSCDKYTRIPAKSILEQDAEASFNSKRLLMKERSVADEKCSNEYSTTLSSAEANYESTFRSCLGTNCFADPVELPSNRLTRIGLLAPDKSGADAILKMLRAVGLNNNADLEVVVDSHVPAYGYGKNHGWSRIIRLSRRLLPHSFALVSKSLEAESGDQQKQVMLDAQVV